MDSGNTAWLIAATALVLFMTPGVAFFYGGLVKAKSVVSMMMMSFGAMGLIAVLWILYGANMSAIDTESKLAFANAAAAASRIARAPADTTAGAEAQGSLGAAPETGAEGGGTAVMQQRSSVTD